MSQIFEGKLLEFQGKYSAECRNIARPALQRGKFKDLYMKQYELQRKEER